MEQNSDLILFFGRFHPLVLHLPIGFLSLAFILEILSRFRKFEAYKHAVGLILFLGVVFAAIAAVLGLMLAQGGGYGETLLSLHQWLGISTTLVALTALILRWLAQKKSSLLLDKFYLTVLTLMTVLLMGAGHFGGSLTHGSDYLTQYMPNPLRRMAGLEPRQEKKTVQLTNLAEAQLYNDVIYPILENHCISCHNPDKKKGELMMHTTEALLKGGEDGAIFKAGNAAESHMIKRILLPENDEKHMPPEGKRPLTDDQIKLLSWWIEEGAPFDKQLTQVNINPEIQKALDALVDPNANKTEVEILLAAGVNVAEEQTINHLAQQGIQVMKLADDMNWLQARIPFNRSGDSLIMHLIPVAEQLTILNIGNTQTSDQALSHISQFQKLTRLHLENTQITDHGLVQLKHLNYLEYLNLYGTAISDEGIKQLGGLKNLRKLYVWQTNVTDKGISLLQQSLPELEISVGMETKHTLSEAADTTQKYNQHAKKVEQIAAKN